MPGTAIMDLLLLDESHVILNIREDLLHHFHPGKKFKGKVPALGHRKMEFEVYYNSPLGSYATWQSSQNNGYNLKTFKIKAKPAGDDKHIAKLRPGMSVIVEL